MLLTGLCTRVLSLNAAQLLTGLLSHRAPVSQSSCLTGLLSHRAPVSQGSCLTGLELAKIIQQNSFFRHDTLSVHHSFRFVVVNVAWSLITNSSFIIKILVLETVWSNSVSEVQSQAWVASKATANPENWEITQTF